MKTRNKKSPRNNSTKKPAKRSTSEKTALRATTVRRGKTARATSKDVFATSAVRSLLALVLHTERAVQQAVHRPWIASFARGHAPETSIDQIRDSVPEFGVFRGIPVAWVESLVDTALEEGYLELDLATPTKRRVSLKTARLRLGERGKRVLAGKSKVDPVPFLKDPDTRSHRRNDPRLRVLEEELIKLRARLARAEGRPAFSILPNEVVTVLVLQQPRDLGELAAVRGMGAERVRKYGRKVLRIIQKSENGKTPQARQKGRQKET